MSDIDDLEKYNAEQNKKLVARPSKQLITCPYCKGAGIFFSTICSPEYSLCMQCFGEKYIEIPDVFERTNEHLKSVGFVPYDENLA
jgi:hypothetical protein